MGSKPHEPPTHIAGAVHWFAAPTVQVLVQLEVAESHRPGAQFVVAGVLQAPLPLHVDGGRRVEAVGHAAPMHCVPAAWKAQLPFEHWPVVPQVLAAVAGQRPPGSAPELTFEQLPTDPARLQDLQAAVQAALQQTP